jgi:monofunctional biosynthetic peptidoglycan transglycosylase
VSRRLAIALGILAAAFVLYQWLTWPDLAELASGGSTTSVFIERHRRQAEGRTLHSWVPYEAISDALKQAVLVAEDIDFFGHRGFAIAEVKIAVRETLKEGRRLRGASTITQQLAKNLWLSPSRSPWRKIKELMLTRQLEQELSKRRILELYLNVAQFGPDVFGAEAAAQTYYGIPAARLSAHQAAELAAGLSRPSSWNPQSSSNGYRRRVEIIKGRMREAEWILRQL